VEIFLTKKEGEGELKLNGGYWGADLHCKYTCETNSNKHGERGFGWRLRGECLCQTAKFILYNSNIYMLEDGEFYFCLV
jgi:hypothetical protein